MLTSLPQKTSVAKPNYQYEKRQRELEKKKKKAEKAQRKAGAGHDAPAHEDETGAAPAAPAAPPEADATSLPRSR